MIATAFARRRRPWTIVLLALLVVQPSAVADSLPSPLQLFEVIALALRDRAEIEAARARADAYAQRPAIVGALEDPMISSAIDHYPFDMPIQENGMGGMIETDGSRYDWSVSIEQRFPLSQVRSHRKASARADAQRFTALALTVELDVVLDAQRSFFMLLERRGMRRVIQEQLSIAQGLVAAASSRYSSGSGSQADVLRAEVEVARVRAAEQALAAEVRAAEAMLNVSLGRTAQETIPELQHVTSREQPMAFEEALNSALTRRPELAAGEAEVSRAMAEIEVMRSMYKPMAMVRVGKASTMAEGAGAMVMVGVSVPIWRERLRAGVAEGQAMRRMADADLTAMRRMVEGEAAAAREGVYAARTRLIVLDEEVLPRARMAMDAALASYSSGLGTLVSVVESARMLWELQAEQVMAEAALGEARARMDRAIGMTGGPR